MLQLSAIVRTERAVAAVQECSRLQVLWGRCSQGRSTQLPLLCCTLASALQAVSFKTACKYLDCGLDTVILTS